MNYNTSIDAVALSTQMPQSQVQPNPILDPWTWPERLLLMVYALILLACSRGEMWCDEIWSLWNAETMTSAWEILDLKLDNNHPLNSLWMVLCHRWGIASDFVLRLPSVAFGIAFFALIRRVSLRLFGFMATRFTLVLVAFSYLAHIYFSEARGYAALLFFILAAFASLEDWRSAGRLYSLLLWQILGVLSVISHAGAYIFLAPALFRAVLEPRTSEKTFRTAYPNFLRRGLQNIPLIAIALVWFCFFSGRLQIGGAPFPTPTPEAFGEFFALIIGLQWLSLPTTFLLILGVLALIAIPNWILRKTSHRCTFWLLVTAAVPLATVLILKPTVLVPRYFIASLPFLLLALGNALATCWATSTKGKVASVLIVSVIVAGNVVNTVELLHTGRGNFSSLLNTLIQESIPLAHGEISLEKPIVQPISIGAVAGCGAGPLLSFYRYRKVTNAPDALQWVDSEKFDSQEAHLARLDAVFLPGWAIKKAPEFKKMKGSMWQFVGRTTGAPQSSIRALLYRRVPTKDSDERTPLPFP